MLWSIVLLIVGLAALLVGAELLVRGASSMALLSHIPPAIVGLTIVAAGTSAPEFVVTLGAALRGSPGLAMGNVVGSNIVNIGLILGLTALVRPLRIAGNTVRLEWPVMMIAAMQLHLLARDLLVDRLKGLVLVSAMVAFVAYLVWISRRNATAEEGLEFAGAVSPTLGGSGARAWLLAGLLLLSGVTLLALGAHWLVGGASDLARTFGLPESTIGLTIVAFGTSAPELATSLTAVFRGRDDLAIGNVVGSNIFNVLGILGLASLIYPVPVPLEIVTRDTWWMLAFSALLFPLMLTGMQVVRREGAVLLVLSGAYLLHLFGAFA